MVAIVSPLWRWLVTDLCGSSITLLDHLASERTVTPMLNEPLVMTGTVPSDNSEVNRLHTDGYPFLHEGVRQLYGFRREHETVTAEHDIWTIRASTLLLQVDDAAAQDTARSRFTAYDPWQYLMYQPLLHSGGEGSCSFTPREGWTYTGSPADIALEVLTCLYDNPFVDLDGSIYNQGAYDFPCGTTFGSGVAGSVQSMFIDWGQTGFYTGTWESGPTISIKVDAGMTIGQFLQDLCSTGHCDIVMEPIYDPVNRPGILCQMSVYDQDPADPDTGAGARNWAARFAWDRPGRNTVGADDLFDGSQRANFLKFSRGQAGTYVPEVLDAASLGTYGFYFATQYFPQQQYDETTVEDNATMQMWLRGKGKQTVTLNPAAERAPEPFVDYGIGDRVPVYVSTDMRYPLPPYWAGPPPVGDATIVWQRIYGFPVDIDDNGTETVRELLCGPIGPPPPVTGPGSPGYAELGTGNLTTTALGASGGAGVRTTRRTGRIQVITPFRQGVL